MTININKQTYKNEYNIAHSRKISCQKKRTNKVLSNFNSHTFSIPSTTLCIVNNATSNKPYSYMDEQIALVT